MVAEGGKLVVAAARCRPAAGNCGGTVSLERPTRSHSCSDNAAQMLSWPLNALRGNLHNYALVALIVQERLRSSRALVLSGPILVRDCTIYDIDIRRNILRY